VAVEVGENVAVMKAVGVGGMLTTVAGVHAVPMDRKTPTISSIGVILFTERVLPILAYFT
jgi:hypothetical protein